MEKTTYKKSHLSSGIGKRYELMYFKDTFDSRIWILEKEILKKIIETIIKKKINYFLDFACGTGRILEIFHKNSLNSYGVDVSEDMLKLARQKYKNVKFFNADLLKNENILEYKFDVITVFRFFLNAEENLRNNILEILHKILHDNGILILNNHGNKISNRIIPVIINNIIYKNKIKNLSLKRLIEILNRRGFNVFKIYGLGYLPQIFSYILPKKIWLIIERLIIKLKIFNNFGSNLIIVCNKK